MNSLYMFIICLICITMTIVCHNEYVYAADKQTYILSTATSLEKVFRDTPITAFQERNKSSVNVSACRNEAEAFQIVVMPLDDIAALNWWVDTHNVPGLLVKVEPVGYVNIPQISVRRVQYPEAQRAGWWPDPIYGYNRIKLERGVVQPLWVTISVNKNAPAGVHPIDIYISDGKNEERVSVNLKIWDFDLPDTTHLTTSFWVNEYDLINYYQLVDLPFEMYKKFLKMALDHRVTPVAITDKHAHKSREYPYRAYIEPDGTTYRFDFSKTEQFLRYVFMENDLKGNSVNVAEHHFILGINVTVTEVATSKVIEKTFLPFTIEYENYLIQYIHAYLDMLAKNNWLDKAYIAVVDEPVADSTRYSYRTIEWIHNIIRKNFPSLPIVSAVHDENVLINHDLWDILAPALDKVNPDNTKWWPVINEKRPLWGYICSSTSNIDYQPVDHRSWFWACWKYNLEGFIYWGLYTWGYSAGPNYGSMVKYFPEMRWPNGTQWLLENRAGDGFLIYPSPNGEPWSSIRLENIRDGIEDYEYMYLLRQLASRLNDADPYQYEMKGKAEQLLTIGPDIIRSTTDYCRDPDVFLSRREQIGNLIEQIMHLTDQK